MFRAVRFTIPSVTPRPRSRNVERGRVDLCRARVLAESFDSSVGSSHTGPTHFAQRHGCTARARSRATASPRARQEPRANKKPRGRAGRPVALVVVRFPWGSVLALRCGSPSAPLDVRQGAVTRLRHRRVRTWVPSLRPRPFAWSGKRKVDEAIRCRQLRPITMRRTSETGAISSAEDADSPWTFSDLEEPSPSRVDL